GATATGSPMLTHGTGSASGENPQWSVGPSPSRMLCAFGTSATSHIGPTRNPVTTVLASAVKSAPVCSGKSVGPVAARAATPRVTARRYRERRSVRTMETRASERSLEEVVVIELELLLLPLTFEPGAAALTDQATDLHRCEQHERRHEHREPT